MLEDIEIVRIFLSEDSNQDTKVQDAELHMFRGSDKGPPLLQNFTFQPLIKIKHSKDPHPFYDYDNKWQSWINRSASSLQGRDLRFSCLHGYTYSQLNPISFPEKNICEITLKRIDKIT